MFPLRERNEQISQAEPWPYCISGTPYRLEPTLLLACFMASLSVLCHCIFKAQLCLGLGGWTSVGAGRVSWCPARSTSVIAGIQHCWNYPLHDHYPWLLLAHSFAHGQMPAIRQPLVAIKYVRALQVVENMAFSYHHFCIRWKWHVLSVLCCPTEETGFPAASRRWSTNKFGWVPMNYVNSPLATDCNILPVRCRIV